MDTVIAALTLIAKYAASIRGFETRLANLEKERKRIGQRVARAEKDCEDLLEREENVKAYRRILKKGSSEWAGQTSALKELADRWPEKEAALKELRAELERNERARRFAEDALAKCVARKAETEQAVADAKKAAKHERNRAEKRAKKEARRKARLEAKGAAEAPVPERASVLPGEVVALAEEFGVDPHEDLEVLMELARERKSRTAAQASA